MPLDLPVASNRGPLAFRFGDDGGLTARRGGGGLVSGLGAAIHDSPVLWVCAALSDADREASRRGGGYTRDDTLALRILDIPPSTFERAYNDIANSVLWFVHHLLWNTPATPIFNAAFGREWRGYLDYNRAFAEALAADAAPGARVLVQDYHLFLVPGLLRELRPDLRIAHFTHTPWAPPEYFALLPDDVAAQVLRGVLGADHAGFLDPRWAAAFTACCAEFLGAQVSPAGDSVVLDGRVTTVGVHALGVDAPALRERASRPDVETRLGSLRAVVGSRRVVVRVDRTELSKNIVRGLLAYSEFLRLHPEWHGKVIHLAYAYPSRHDLPEYREYTATVLRAARDINETFGTPDWEPVRLEVADDYPRSLAALRLADVLVVNPLRDGMNLVAKEGPVLSDRGLALILARSAGAATEMSADALLVNAFDVQQTAAALHRALLMPESERLARTERLAAVATALPPAAWFRQQLAVLETD